MSRYFTTALLGLSLLGTGAMVGCDQKVAEDTTIKKNADGTTSKDSKVTSTTQGGGTVTTEEHKKTAP